jgi:hypothetical protein
MSQFQLGAAALALVLCGQAAAQQAGLADRDDRDDPCRRFKMRVLVPAEVDPGLRRPAPDIDPGIVRNPCPRGVPQLGLAPPVRAPEGGGGALSLPPVSFTLPSESRRGKSLPGDPFSPPPAFEFMRRRR